MLGKGIVADHENKRPPRISLAGLLLLALVFPLQAVEWPSENIPLRTSFGQSDRDRPLVGTVFTGEASVRAADAGEVLFVQTDKAFSWNMPQPLGSWVAVDHGNGIVSMYSHLQSAGKDEGRSLVEKASILGSSGESGWSKAKGFGFALVDRIEKRWVNPAMIAPPRKDTKPPAIRSVSLISKDSNLIPLSGTKSVRQGLYNVIVDVTDSEDGSQTSSLAPLHIVCLVNGTESCSLNLETISALNGKFIVSRKNPTPASEVYGNPEGFNLGEIRLNRGKATIDLIVRDASGNERSVSYTLNLE